MPTRHRGVAGVQHLSDGAVIHVDLGIVAEPLLGEGTVADGSATVRAWNVRRGAVRRVRDDIVAQVILPVGNRMIRSTPRASIAATVVDVSRKEVAHPERGLATSFKLDPKQMTDLIRQTGSSFYLFQCPGLLDRGVPIVPTQLVEDLARHHAASAKQIPADLVGPASRPFAEWLTYMVLGLRTGDPLAELVAKAEGGDGRRPRPLARFGTVEIALRVGETKPDDR